MKYTSILEKLQCLFGLIKSSSIYVIFLGIMFLILILFFVKKIEKNKFVLAMTILYLFLFGIVIFNNFNNLSSTFDSIMDNLFLNIYFPSVYVYLFILLVIDIVTFISLFNIKTEKIYKRINCVCCGIIQFILVMIMDITATGEVDIFSKSSLFTNTKLVMMLELSVNVFIMWIILLMLVFLINGLTSRILAIEVNKSLEKDSVTVTNSVIDTITNDRVVDDYLFDNNTVKSESLIYDDTVLLGGLNDITQKSIDENMIEKPVVDVFEDNNKVCENVKVDEQKSANDIFDMILNNSLPVIKEENVEKVDKNNYTLNDYKIFNKMLKEIKMYNIGSIVNVDKVLELRLLDKFSNEEYNLFKKMLKSYSN